MLLFAFVCSQYLTELLTERQKLGPFMQVLPFCTRLLNQGISMYSNSMILLRNFFSYCFIGYNGIDSAAKFMTSFLYIIVAIKNTRPYKTSLLNDFQTLSVVNTDSNFSLLLPSYYQRF